MTLHSKDPNVYSRCEPDAIETPGYQLFYEGDKPEELKLPELRGVPMTAKERKQTIEIAKLLSQIKSDRHRNLAHIKGSFVSLPGQRLSRLVSRPFDG
jgi:hypothetical protein